VDSDGVVQSGSLPHVRATRPTAQSIPNATETTVIYNTEEYDDDSEYNPSTGIFTAKRDGRLRVTASCLFAQSSAFGGTERAELTLVVNGSPYARLGRKSHFTGANCFIGLGGSTTVEVNEGDALKITVYQNSGGSRNLYGAPKHNWVCFDWLL